MMLSSDPVLNNNSQYTCLHSLGIMVYHTQLLQRFAVTVVSLLHY
jgi:hypothetical protein